MPDSELQKKVDSVYPQNHCYNIDTLEGNNEGTVERSNQIISHINDKITGKTILDIGCNKGLFSLWCALNGAKEVIAQDINPEYTRILHDVMMYKIRNSDISKNISDLKYKQLSHRIKLTAEPVGAYYHEGDFALILGAAHYLTYEYGLDWIYRLYIMGYDIFVELPLSAEDPVVKAHESSGTATEKSKMLNMESFLAKTKGLYEVEEVGRSTGLGRHLLYCKKIRIPEKQIHDIEFKDYELIYDVGGMTQVFRKEGCVVKLNFKYEHYPDRWMRIHVVLHKEFPEIIPELYYAVKDADGNTKGKITEYLNSGTPNYRNLFRIQNYSINNLNMMMIDFHPNHVHGNHVVDLEAIENIDTYCMGYLYRFVNETWKVGGVYEDPDINQQAVQQFVDNISNRAAYFAASMAGYVDKYTVIKNIKEIFKEAEEYNWSKNPK